MSALVRAEVRRVMSRRVFRLLLVLVTLAIVASAIMNSISSDRDVSGSREAARQVVSECEGFRAGGDGGEKGFDCPSVGEVAAELDPRFSYAQDMPDTVRVVAILLSLLGFAVGASALGAEWAAGTMTTLLAWEPRRGRVLGSKVVGTSVVVGCAVATLLVLLSLVHVPVAVWRGDPAGMTKGMWWTLAGVWLRGGLLAATTSAVGLGLASVVRNTAGAVGIGFAYVAVADPILGNAWSGRFVAWALQRNVPWILGFAPSVDGGPGGQPLIPSASVARPVLLMCAYAAVAVLAGYATLRARDVT